ncbi:Eco57I restriction-modification methylase domain-containing protein [Natrialbaceae archaeon A-chndr2]
MKGHVPTPPDLALRIVEKLFEDSPPSEGDRILYPGFGSNAPFPQAVHEWCQENNYPVPSGIGVELDPDRIADAECEVEDLNVELLERDFLDPSIPDELDGFDYIVGNPPYVPVTRLSDEEKDRYREQFTTAWRRFDLYILFFEQALGMLESDGRVSFVTPEKYAYIESASNLRELLTEHHIREIHHVKQEWFDGLKTYPAVTTLDAAEPIGETRIVHRDGSQHTTTLPTDGSSWAPEIRNVDIDLESGVTLGDITIRISAGLATGRDSLYVQSEDEIAPQLLEEGWAYPTTSGKQLRTNDGPYSTDYILCPYDERGNLVSEDQFGAYGDWAELHRDELESRSCVKKRNRVWYDWHEAPPMTEILRPKIVCKDVCKEPEFWAETEGDVIPRHSVYYIVPESHVELDALLAYLNSEDAVEWIKAHAQKAYTDHYRIQSEVIEDLPVPEEFADTVQSSLTNI